MGYRLRASTCDARMMMMMMSVDTSLSGAELSIAATFFSPLHLCLIVFADLQEGQQHAIEEAVRNERQVLESQRSDVKNAGNALKEERSRVNEVLEQKAEVQRELEDARSRLAAYEKGYGLEDAVREQERLREAITRRDADIAKLTATAGRQLDAYDVLMEIALRLSERAGLPRNADIFKLYPELDLRTAIESNLERLRSVNSELQRQNDSLEEQRMKLLRQLRVHAEQMGDKSLRYFGLSAEQLMLVNEFAENLRDGRVELPVNDRTVELQGEVRRLRIALEETKEQLSAATSASARAFASIPAAPVPQVAADGSKVAEQVSQAAQREMERQHVAMRDTLQQVADENRKLREAMEGMIGEQTKKFASMRLNAPAAPSASAAGLADAGSAGAEAAAALHAVTALLRARIDDAASGGAAASAAPSAGDIVIGASDISDVLLKLSQVSAIVDDLRAKAAGAAGATSVTGAQVEVLSSQLAEARTQADLLRIQLSQAQDQAARSAKTPLKSPPPSSLQRESSDAGFGPRSPAGKQMQNQMLQLIRRSNPDGAPMPAEEWNAEVTDARSALVEALEDLAAREDEVKKLEKASKDYTSHLSAMMAQQTALYREYIAEKAKWEAECNAAKDREAAAVERAEAAEVKAKRLDEMASVLEGGLDPSHIDAASALTYVATMPSAASASTTAADSDAAIARLRTYVRVLARKLAAMEVTQPILARKYNVLKQEAASARAGQRTAELSAVEAEAHMRQRILYLELWKKGAESRLERLTEVMESWVPGEEHATMVADLAAMQTRLADLLASEGELRVRCTELRSLPFKISELEATLKVCQADLDQSQSLLSAARDDAAQARASMSALTSSNGTGSDPTSSAALLHTATRAELISTITRQQANLNSLEIEIAGLTKKHSIAAERVVELEGALSSLQQRSTQAEDALVESRASAVRAQSEIAHMQASTSAAGGGLTAAAASQLRDQLHALQDERDSLSRELHKAREIADIASDQAASVTGITKDREGEMEELREALRNLSGRSDDDAIIGRLQAQVLALKASFHSFLRKHDGMRTAMQRTRVAATALEVVVDQRAGEVMAVREDARVKQLALQRLVDDMRGQMRALEAGGLSMALAQSFNDSVRRLSAAVDRQQLELEESLRARHAAEEEAEGRGIEITSLQRTLDDLRAASGRGGAGAGSAAGESKDVVRRLIDLNHQLKAAELGILRHRRENTLLRDEARLAKKRIEDYEQHVRALEERIVSADTDQRRREDDYRRQLRAAVAQAQAEAREVNGIAAAAKDGLAADVAAATASIGAGGLDDGEAASRAIGLEAQVASMRSALDRAEKDVRSMRERADTAVEKARMRKRRVDFLERQLEIHGVDIADLRAGFEEMDAGDAASVAGSEAGARQSGGRSRSGTASGANSPANADDDDGAGAAKQKKQSRSQHPDYDAKTGLAQMKEQYEEESKRLQKAAQATIGSLKELIAQKNKTINDYQDKLESIRRERDAERARGVSERERLADAARAESSAHISDLRRALDQLRSAPASTATAIIQQQLADRADAAERGLEQRDRRIEDLQASVQALSQSLSSAEGRVVTVGVDADSLQNEIEKLRKQKDEAEKRLREGLSVRDRKLKTLQASFAALKEQFVRAEEEHAAAIMQLQSRANARMPGSGPDASRVGGKSALNQSTASAGGMDGEMKEKVQILVEQVQRMGKEVRALKAKEAEAEADKENLQRDLDRAQAQVTSFKSASSKAENDLARSRGDISRLQHELATARMEMQTRLAEALAHGAKMGADGVLSSTSGGDTESHIAAADIASLQRKLKVLEAQNAALRSAQAEAGSASMNSTLDASQLQTMITAAAAAQAKAAMMSSQQSYAGDVNVSGRPPLSGGSPTALGPASSSVVNGNNNQADVRLAWEEQRKLRKKLEMLSTKLTDKTREAETSRNNEIATGTALAKVKSERDALEKRLNALIKKQQSLDAATVAALNEIEPVAVLKSRVFDLEEECSMLRERCDGALTGEIRKLQADIETERLKATASAAAASEARDRLRQLQKLVGVGADGDATAEQSVVPKASGVRLEEDRFLAEATLRDKLSECRRNIASLEGSLLSKDAVVMELQFELEASRQAADRLRKRIAEVTAFATIATRGKPLSEAAAAGAMGSNLASLLNDPLHNGGRSSANGGKPLPGKREAELEEVITALKRVTEKQKSEIDRLRKQVTASGHAKAAAAADAAANATAIAMASKEGARSSAVAPTLPTTGASELAESARALRLARAEIAQLKERLSSLQGVTGAGKSSSTANLDTGHSSSSSAAVGGAAGDKAAAEQLRTRLQAAESEGRRLASEVEALRLRSKQAEEREAVMEKKLRETGNASSIPAALPPAPAPTAPSAAAPAPPPLESARSARSSASGGLLKSSIASIGAAALAAKRAQSATTTTSGKPPAASGSTVAGASSTTTTSTAAASSALVSARSDGTSNEPSTTAVDLSLASPSDLKHRVSTLERENAELREELSAFDLDFFEEIEDLKYK